MQKLTLQDLIILSTGLSQYKKVYGTSKAFEHINTIVRESLLDDKTIQNYEVQNNIIL
tara:strand:- start:157 stop:330 length:174 start_codon:yes stop_codon:yes gene_type:complete